MSFNVIPARRVISTMGQVQVSIRDKNGQRRFNLSIAERVATGMGWKTGDTIELSIGEGTDEGKVRFRLGDKGHVLSASTHSTRLTLVCRAWTAKPDRYESAPAEFTVITDTQHKALIVTLPWGSGRSK